MAPAGRKRTRWWTDAEDDQLRQLVAEHGTTNWVFISQFIPGRNGKSCRLRWTNQIAPEVVHAPFTSAEDAKIVEEYRRHGNRWAAIARLLPGRTENSVKNRWHACLKHKVGKAGEGEGEGEGREEGLGSKRRSRDEGFGIEVGRASKKAKLGLSPVFSYISRPISAAMNTTTSEITSPTNMVLSPSATSTEEQRSVVVSPSVSSSETPSSTDLSNSRSDTCSSIALKPKNFDAGADDPLTALSRWFPYGD